MPQVRQSRRGSKKSTDQRRPTSKRYTQRPSPALPAGKCPGQSRVGNDGRIYKSVPNKNGVHRWVHTHTLLNHAPHSPQRSRSRSHSKQRSRSRSNQSSRSHSHSKQSSHSRSRSHSKQRPVSHGKQRPAPVSQHAKRPSPPVSAQAHRGKTMRGNDQHMYKSIPDKNNVHHWKRLPSQPAHNAQKLGGG